MAIEAVPQVGGRSGQRWLMNGSHGDAGYHSTVTMAGRAGSACASVCREVGRAGKGARTLAADDLQQPARARAVGPAPSPVRKAEHQPNHRQQQPQPEQLRGEEPLAVREQRLPTGKLDFNFSTFSLKNHLIFFWNSIFVAFTASGNPAA